VRFWPIEDIIAMILHTEVFSQLFSLAPTNAFYANVRRGPIANICKREHNPTMRGKTTAFVLGALLASLFWIVLAQQSYCTGSWADLLKIGDVEECR